MRPVIIAVTFAAIAGTTTTAAAGCCAANLYDVPPAPIAMPPAAINPVYVVNRGPVLQGPGVYSYTNGYVSTPIPSSPTIAGPTPTLIRTRERATASAAADIDTPDTAVVHTGPSVTVTVVIAGADMVDVARATSNRHLTGPLIRRTDVRSMRRIAIVRRCACARCTSARRDTEPVQSRHARACRGHPRLCSSPTRKAWMAGT